MTSEFGDRLSALCVKELSAEFSDHKRIGKMIASLTYSLAFTIAIACRGNSEAMQTLLTGAEAYLYEASADHLKTGELISKLKP